MNGITEVSESGKARSVRAPSGSMLPDIHKGCRQGWLGGRGGAGGGYGEIRVRVKYVPQDSTIELPWHCTYSIQRALSIHHVIYLLSARQ